MSASHPERGALASGGQIAIVAWALLVVGWFAFTHARVYARAARALLGS